jgi:hypothetical protein
MRLTATFGLKPWAFTVLCEIQQLAQAPIWREGWLTDSPAEGGLESLAYSRSRVQ